MSVASQAGSPTDAEPPVGDPADIIGSYGALAAICHRIAAAETDPARAAEWRRFAAEFTRIAESLPPAGGADSPVTPTG